MFPFVVFPMDSVPFVVRGDYANVQVPVNLTLESLDKNLFGGTPLSGSLYAVGEAARNGGPAVPPLAGIPAFPPLPVAAPAAPKDKGLLPAGGTKLPSLPKIGN
jgi:phospholipid/cholesterol/gamma-HCH transport system substrate-binding protein